MKRESVRERAAQIYAAIIGDWSIEATLEKSLEMAVDAAILFESHVDAEIEAKIAALDAEVNQPKDSTKTAPKEITIDMELPVKLVANQYLKFIGTPCRIFDSVDVELRRGDFVEAVRSDPVRKMLLIHFISCEATAWLKVESIKEYFELCESQS